LLVHVLPPRRLLELALPEQARAAGASCGWGIGRCLLLDMDIAAAAGLAGLGFCL